MSDTHLLARQLLAWYDRERRDLPWRAKPGAAIDPYAVWVSEIMLQQTTVAATIPYYKSFMARWPTPEALAAAPLDAVLHAWQGLGYYARARNLHRCARVIVADHGGRLPAAEEALRTLPGIGAYTAAAIAAIAFDARATPVDGNVARVMARLHRVEEPLPAARPRLERLAAALTPAGRPGDFAQALMDLGATVCAPRQPRCALCPWTERCAARAAGTPGDYPKRAAKGIRPTRHAVAFWLQHPQRGIWLRRRPPEGLLGGMTEIPSTPWRDTAWRPAEAAAFAPCDGDWRPLPALVEHAFTHFRLRCTVLAARAERTPADGGFWCRPEDLALQALPTVMKKLVKAAGSAVAAAPPASPKTGYASY